MMTPDQLRLLVDYDPDTGHMLWKPRGSRRWNSNFAGKPAFANPSKDGYLTGRLLGRNYKSHRVAWAISTGEWPSGLIDHINGVRADNRLDNLRVVDDAGNAQNQARRSNNTSGEQCISWFARDSKWWVKITKDRKQIHIGFFDKLADAIIARDAAYKVAGFHKNHGKRSAILPPPPSPGEEQ
jgi:hypothetical protein